MTKKFYLGLMAVCALFLSCEKSDLAGTVSNVITEDAQKSQVFDLMLAASTNPVIVEEMNGKAIASLNVGLEESIYLDEVMYDSDATMKSDAHSNILKEFITSNLGTTRSLDDVTMVVDGIEIYWPYCENWDGYSQPVIVINEYDDNQFIEDDKVYAYRAVDGGVEKLIVDEEYSMSNPVWVISESDVTLEDIVNLKAGNYESTNIVPRAKSSDVVCEVNATRLTSTVQHDTWINGGSEYVIYWFHQDPNQPDSIKMNVSGQIKLSRKEISNATPKDFIFTGNFDWSADQRYNRLKVIEYDPGNNMEIPIKLTASFGDVDVELETTITINENDELIMDYHIQRQAMFTEGTYIDDMHYQKVFNCVGVTLQTTITCFNKVDEM